MNFLDLATSGMRRNRVRVALSLLCITFAFALFGVLAGVDQSFDEAMAGLDGDSRRLFVTSRVSQLDQLPLAYLEKIRQIEGVLTVFPSTRLYGYYQSPDNWVGGFAVDAIAEFSVYSEFRVPAEQVSAMNELRTGAIAGRNLAQQYGWKIGDRITLLSDGWQRSGGDNSWVFDIVGIYDAPDPSLGRSFFLNYEYLNEARDVGKDSVGNFIVAVRPGEDVGRVAAQIDSQFANSADETFTQSGKETRRNRLRQFGDIKLLVSSIVSATLVLLFFLIGNEIRQSTDNRIHELALLKALGFPGGYVFALVLAEALMLTVIGCIVGLLIASQLITMLPKYLGYLSLPLSTSMNGVAIAGVLAIVSSILPAVRIHRLPVVDVLRGSQ